MDPPYLPLSRLVLLAFLLAFTVLQGNPFSYPCLEVNFNFFHRLSSVVRLALGTMSVPMWGGSREEAPLARSTKMVPMWWGLAH